MLPERRAKLTEALAALSRRLADDLRAKIRDEPEARDRARAVYTDERVADDFIVWTDLLARRAAVLWVLKSVYVRVLEDRGLLRPVRILDPESQQLFARLAPNLGETAYLRWIYRDLASPTGGLPELFAPQPAEVVNPSDTLSRALLDFWRTRDPDTGALAWRFTDEHFDGRLLGDLYQDLDPVVKERYALLQTPEFIVDFILDETLTPALAEWGVETVRVIDPACGSGHFLLAVFKRLVRALREKYPERPPRDVVRDVLARVVGIDLNDYACALARARLVMTALEACDESDLAKVSDLHPQVYWADALEQVERDTPAQLTLQGVLLTDEVKPRATLTRPEVRAALRPIVQKKFHVVVGNPPYITERDKARKEYHREKVGKTQRYVSASGLYSLGAPFTERMLQLAIEGGYVGEITANSFMKREFGKALIEKVLAKKDFSKVVDTSGAYIAGHGTPTVLLFIRNRPPTKDNVPVVMGKRGEPSKPTDGLHGKVWSSILRANTDPSFENEYISFSFVPKMTLDKHEWSIGGGGALELKIALDKHATTTLEHQIIERPGRAFDAGEDDLWRGTQHFFAMHGLTSQSRALVDGEGVRNWSIRSNGWVLYPYEETGALSQKNVPAVTHLWRWRTNLSARTIFGKYVGDQWWSFLEYHPHRIKKELRIVIGEVSTHNQFALGKNEVVCNRTAPMFSLPSDRTEAQYFSILAQLNSSVACFWLKQVCQNKGADSARDRGFQDEWEEFYQFGGTKLQSFPLAATEDATLEAFARKLDALARERVADSARAVIDAHAAKGAAALRQELDARQKRDLDALFRMVGLQEELDWYCYRLYGVNDDATSPPDPLSLKGEGEPEGTALEAAAAKVSPLRPGLRPFEVALARRDAENREALARGDEPDETPTAWFTRHGWTPVTTLEALPEAERAKVQARIERAASSRELGLLEQPTYKRRWYQPDPAAEEAEALEAWLSDRIEDWAKTRKEPFTVAQVASALQAEPALLAVAEVLTGRPDVDLEALVAERVVVDAVPMNKHHVFKSEGLKKRAAWEETWRLQHLEDAGQTVTPEVPPKYTSADYLRGEYWALRGKLDVPRERFVALTSVPNAQGAQSLYLWAGLTARERVHVLLDLDETLESDGVTAPDRVGMLYDAWFLLPYVGWESKKAEQEFTSVIRGLVGKQGVTAAMLDDWAASHPPPRARGAAARPIRRRDIEAHRKGRAPKREPGVTLQPVERLAIVVEEVARAEQLGATEFFARVAERDFVAQGVKGTKVVRRGAKLQVEDFEETLRELADYALVAQGGGEWRLSSEGRALAEARPTEDLSRFARGLCEAANLHLGGTVTNLLERMTALNPKGLGAVMIPNTDGNIPEERAELEAWLSAQMEAWFTAMARQMSGFAPIRAAREVAAEVFEKAEDLRSERSRAIRQTRFRHYLDEVFLDLLFGAETPRHEVQGWQRRMDLAGITHRGRQMIERPPLDVWFPVGEFTSEPREGQEAVPKIRKGLSTFHRRTLPGADGTKRFLKSLDACYQRRTQAEQTEVVSLYAVRDLVCYQLRVGHEVFAEHLQAMVERAMRRKGPFLISLEVDRTLAERSREEWRPPIVIDGTPLYAIMMRPRT